MSDTFIRETWLNRLDPQIADLVSIVGGDLDTMARQADVVFDRRRQAHAQRTTFAAAVERSPRERTPTPAQTRGDSNQRQTIEGLLRKVEALQLENNRLQRGRQRGRSPTPGRARAPSANENPSWCWFHNRYGRAAKNCRPPCRFPKQGN